MSKNRTALAVGLTAILLAGVSFFLLNSVPSDAADKAPAATEAPAAAAEAASDAKDSNLLAAPAASKIDVAEVMKDRVLGDEKAPVTIIEYASLTCHHCAHFDTQILPEVKKKLLDTGKAKLIFRDFPLDGIALKASMMARCVSPLQYFNMLDVLFAKQDAWTKAKDPLEELQKLGSLAGLDAASFKSCIENKDLETAILNEIKTAQEKYKLEATPSFIFNDGAEKFSGARSADEFAQVVNKLSKGK